MKNPRWFLWENFALVANKKEHLIGTLFTLQFEFKQIFCVTLQLIKRGVEVEELNSLWVQCQVSELSQDPSRTCVNILRCRSIVQHSKDKHENFHNSSQCCFNAFRVDLVIRIMNLMHRQTFTSQKLSKYPFRNTRKFAFFGNFSTTSQRSSHFPNRILWNH